MLTSKSIGRPRLFTASPADGETIAGSAAIIATTATVDMAWHMQFAVSADQPTPVWKRFSLRAKAAQLFAFGGSVDAGSHAL